MLEIFKGISGEAAFLDSTSPQSRAYEWIVSTDRVQSFSVVRRYLLATIFYGASSHSGFIVRPEYADLGECDWTSVTCEDGQVTGINLARQLMPLDGTIPGVELGELTSLTSLDLSENTLKGSIPEEIYTLTSLTGLFLHNNEMTGTISNSIENLFSLHSLMLNHNQLTGTMPRELRSREFIRPLRKSSAPVCIASQVSCHVCSLTSQFPIQQAFYTSTTTS
jgi:hypothetical protein